MDIWCKNNAWQVMTNTRKGRTDGAVLRLHAARGGQVSGQVLLRALKAFTINGAEVLWQGAGPAAATLWLQGFQNYNDGVPYPDRVLPMQQCEIPAHRTQGILVQVQVPVHAQPGRYSFKVVIHTTEEDVTATVQLQIHSVLIPDPASAVLDHEYFFNVTSLEPFYAVCEPGSDEWWDIMHKYAVAMKELRINTLSTQVVTLLAGRSRRTGERQWSFDFSLVDAFIEKFFEWGSFRRVAVGAPLTSLTGAEITILDEEGALVKVPVRSSEGEAFAECLLSAMYSHFEEKGWLSMIVMHIEDEPHESENWLWFREKIRRFMPGVPCSEPIDEYDSALALKGGCNEFIPRLEVFEQERDYFSRRQAAGDKVWCYSCCYPEQQWYLNKFVDLPSRYSRMLYWAAFAQDITGFLHWGFNYWNAFLYGLSPDARFKGDGHIIYPDAENKAVLHSNRGLATTQGAEEYELLYIAAEKYPAEAKALAMRLTRSFSDFDDDPELLESLRTELFALCEF